jgi:predicted nucleic acid-binding protein
VSVYVDASVLVALFTNDALAGRADAYLRTNPTVLIVSDFAAAEFASAVARRVRIRDISCRGARLVLASFDDWIARATARIFTSSEDVASAAILLRRFDLPLRTPDAMNLAIALRVGAEVLTFDQKMAASARNLGAVVVLG